MTSECFLKDVFSGLFCFLLPVFSLKNNSVILNKLRKKEITQSSTVILERAEHAGLELGRVRQEKSLGYKGT